MYVSLPRGASLALLCLVDVGCRAGGGLVLALEVNQGDVVADDILLGVDAVVEVANGSGQSTSEGIVVVDDLVRCRDHVVGRGEVEGARRAPAALASLLGPANSMLDLLDNGGGGGSSGQSKGDDSELHCDARGDSECLGMNVQLGLIDTGRGG